MTLTVRGSCEITPNYDSKIEQGESNVHVIGRSKNLYMKKQEVKNSTKLYGNKEVAESTIRSVAAFLVTRGGIELYGKETLLRLKVSPLTLEDCRMGKKIIETNLFVRIVPNAQMRNEETGGTLVTRIVTLGIEEEVFLAVQNNQKIESVNSCQMSEAQMIFVSTQAWETIELYCIQLQKTEEARSKVVSNGSVSFTQVHTEKTKIYVQPESKSELCATCAIL